MAPEEFIRRIPYPNSKAAAKDFKCRQDETGISISAREQELLTDEGLVEYQEAWTRRLPSHDSPALWLVLLSDFSAAKLAVAHKPRNDDPFGHLHWETKACPDEDQRRVLARLVSARTPILAFREAPSPS